MARRRRLVFRAPHRGMRFVLALAVLTAIVGVFAGVALLSAAAAPATLETTSLALSLDGVELTSGYSGDLSTGVSFTARATDLGLSPGEPPHISAPSAVLLNLDTGKVLFSQSPDERRAMASTTKIMTALVVLEELPLTKAVTASAKAEATDESQIMLKKGEVLSVEELLCALLVGSANDAAVDLAEAASGSVEAFVSKMNEKASELGLTNTHFVNPHGLDAAGHYSSARDLATLARYAMRNPEFRKLVGTWKHTIPATSQAASRPLTNHNALLGELSWITGVKTGFTDDAGYCLVASGEKNGVSVMSVVLDEPSREACWNESKTLLDYGLTQCRSVTLLQKGTAVVEANVPYEPGEKLRLVTKESVELNLSKGDEVVVTVKMDRELRLPVQAGETFGTLTLTVRGETLGKVALVAERNCSKPTLGSKLAYFFRRVFHRL